MIHQNTERLVLLFCTSLPTLEHITTHITMLDINLFLEERGGEPELIRESQRRRHESVELVDEIIALYDDWKKSR